VGVPSMAGGDVRHPGCLTAAVVDRTARGACSVCRGTAGRCRLLVAAGPTPPALSRVTSPLLCQEAPAFCVGDLMRPVPLAART
jgi:hypothetical protein